MMGEMADMALAQISCLDVGKFPFISITIRVGSLF